MQTAKSRTLPCFSPPQNKASISFAFHQPLQKFIFKLKARNNEKAGMENLKTP